MPKELPLRRRSGRVVDCDGLENRCTARYRGFESLLLRIDQKTHHAAAGWVFLCPKSTSARAWVDLGHKKTSRDGRSGVGFLEDAGSPPWDHGVIPALALRWIWGIKKPASTVGAA